MSEKSWASLAPLLDNRRYVESIVAGIKIKAHPQFRLVATMNDDASTFELPEYIHSRLQPQIFIDFPERDEEFQILRENLPFAEERILQYVTDFLQLAHAADERYTVRDGINVARFAIKLKSLATERTHETEALEHAIVAGAGRRGAALCPRNPTFRFLTPAASKRGRFTYFPVAPGRLEFAIEVRRAILRERPQCVAAGVARQPAKGLDAGRRRGCRRCPLIFYPDEAAGGDQAVYVPVEPADPFTEAIRTALEIGAEIVFADPEAGTRPHLKDAYPDSYAIRYIGLDRYIEAYRVYPQPRSEEIARHAAGIAWKLQGTDPSASVLVVVSLNLLDPLLDAMEEPQAQPLARDAREGVEAAQSASRIAGRNLRRVSRNCSGVTRPTGKPMTRRQPDRPAPRPTRGLPRGRKGIRGQYRRAHRPLAAAPAGALLAQPGAGRERTSARALRPDGGGPRRGRR